MRVVLMVALTLLGVTEARAAMSDVEKKLCLVLSATKLPTIPGGAITASTVADGEQEGGRAVGVLLGEGSYRYARELSDTYGLFTAAQLMQMQRAAEKGNSGEARAIIIEELTKFMGSAGIAEISIKSGPLEATYALGCISAGGRMMVRMIGLAR